MEPKLTMAQSAYQSPGHMDRVLPSTPSSSGCSAKPFTLQVHLGVLLKQGAVSSIASSPGEERLSKCAWCLDPVSAPHLAEHKHPKRSAEIPMHHVIVKQSLAQLIIREKMWNTDYRESTHFPHAGPRAYWRFCNPQQGAWSTKNLIKREPVQYRGDTHHSPVCPHCLWGALCYYSGVFEQHDNVTVGTDVKAKHAKNLWRWH